MAKKPSNPQPEPENAQAPDLSAQVAPTSNEPQPDAPALDAQASPPAPDVAEPSESLIAVVARLHARIVSLESRLDTLAAHHLQTYGKTI